MTNDEMIKKYNYFKTHIGMNICEKEYKQIIAFLTGLDLGCDRKLLDGFREYILVKYNIKSPFWIAVLVQDTFLIECATKGIENNDGNLIQFLFDLLDDHFGAEKMPIK